MTIVKNTPSMSPRFRGFDFKDSFHDVAPAAKVSAIADNLAAALGPGPPHPPEPEAQAAPEPEPEPEPEPYA